MNQERVCVKCGEGLKPVYHLDTLIVYAENWT